MASASEFPEAGAISSGFGLGTARAGIVTRYHATETVALGLTINMTTFDRESSSDATDVYSYDKTSSSAFGFEPGLRYYFSDVGPLWFGEIAASLTYVKDESEFYRDSDTFGTTERFSNLDGWEYGLNLYVGMEEFLTDHISLDARVGWTIDYLDQEGEREENVTESSSLTRSGTIAVLGVNFYW